MAGSSALLPGSSIAFHPHLEFLSRTKSYHAPRGYGDLFAGLGVASRSLVLVAQIEVAETRQLDLLALLQRLADDLEKGIHEFLGLALVEADVGKQLFGHGCLGQGHVILAIGLGNRSPARPRHRPRNDWHRHL